MRLLTFSLTIIFALACGGGGGGGGSSSVITSDAPIVISGTVDDDTGLSKPGLAKVSVSGFSIEATNLTTNVAIPSANLTFNSSTGAYTVSVPQGTPFTVSFTQSGVTVMSRVLSASDTQSDSSKNVSLVTHLQATRILKELETSSLDTAISKVNTEIFGISTPQESGLTLSNLPQSMRVAVMTYREAAANIGSYSSEITTLNNVFKETTTTFAQSYTNSLAGTLATLHDTAKDSNTDILDPYIYELVESGDSNETPGAGTSVSDYSTQSPLSSDSTFTSTNDKLRPNETITLKATFATSAFEQSTSYIVNFYAGETLIGTAPNGDSTTFDPVNLSSDGTHNIEARLTLNGSQLATMNLGTVDYGANQAPGFSALTISSSSRSSGNTYWTSTGNFSITAQFWDGETSLIIEFHEENSDGTTTLLGSFDGSRSSIYFSSTLNIEITEQKVLKVRARDSFDYIDFSYPITLNLESQNQAPVISSVTGTGTYTNQDSITLTVNASDANSDPLEYTITQGPSSASIDSSGVTTWIANQSGTVSLTFEVSDGALTALETVSLTVTNTAPTLSPIPDASIVAGDIYSYPVIASDPDSDTITYNVYDVTNGYRNSFSGMEISSTGLFEWDSNTVNREGALILEVSVSDGIEEVVQTFSFTVNNDPPSIEGVLSTNAIADVPFSYQMNAQDEDNGHSIEYKLDDGPTGLTISSTGQLSWENPISGYHILELNIYDGFTRVYTSTNLGVHDIFFEREPYTIGKVGSLFSSNITAYNVIEANDTSLTYTISSNQTWLSISDNGFITGTPPSSGVFDIEYTVSNSYLSKTKKSKLVILDELSDSLIIDVSSLSSSGNYSLQFESNYTPSFGGNPVVDIAQRIILKKISAGSFLMGSPENEFGRSSDETQRSVTITHDYMIAVFETSRSIWDYVINGSAITSTSPKDSVSWNQARGGSWPNGLPDASSFIGLLRERTGLNFDLPTEAQWEFSCRAGTSSALYSGDETTDVLNDPALNSLGVAYSVTSITSGLPNSTKSPNGLYDMYGYNAEWCLDYYGSYSSNVVDPVGPTTGTNRVKRGGSTSSNPPELRSASRDSQDPASSNRPITFRIVLK
jgi:hypothetical protein